MSDTKAVSLALAQIRALRFKVEKEEMRRGFYFPNAGQATQAPTDDVYPVRYLTAEIALADGTTITGHLMTTTLYVEGADNTQKVVLMAKIDRPGRAEDAMTWFTRREIRLEEAAVPGASVQIDLSQAGFAARQPPVIFQKPEPGIAGGNAGRWQVDLDGAGRRHRESSFLGGGG